MIELTFHRDEKTEMRSYIFLDKAKSFPKTNLNISSYSVAASPPQILLFSIHGFQIKYSNPTNIHRHVRASCCSPSPSPTTVHLLNMKFHAR